MSFSLLFLTFVLIIGWTAFTIRAIAIKNLPTTIIGVVGLIMIGLVIIEQYTGVLNRFNGVYASDRVMKPHEPVQRIYESTPEGKDVRPIVTDEAAIQRKKNEEFVKRN